MIQVVGVALSIVVLLGCADPVGECKVNVCAQVCAQSTTCVKSMQRDLDCVHCLSDCERVR
jgi:hypothetical protein